MKNSKLILFDSMQANFRLSVDTMFEKVKADGTTRPTVFINKEKETGTFSPSCFLVFTYLTDDFTTTKGIYTSIPHIYKIREAFETMRNMLVDPAAYTNIDGALAVDPNYSQPIVIDGLSLKNNDWISLTLTTYKTDMSGVNSRPAVALQHSKSNGYSSILTDDEFKTIYDIIMHLDYVSISNQAVIIELLSRNAAASQAAGYSRPAPAPYAPRQQAVPQAPRVPTYQNYPPRTAAPAPQQQVYNNVQPQQPQNSAPIPPRPATAGGPKITMDAVKDIEVEDMSLDDSSLVDNIFNNNDQ